MNKYFVFEDCRSKPEGNPEAFREVPKAEAFKVCDENETVIVFEVEQIREGFVIYLLSYQGADLIRNPDFWLKATSIDNDLMQAMLKIALVSI